MFNCSQVLTTVSSSVSSLIMFILGICAVTRSYYLDFKLEFLKVQALSLVAVIARI